MLDSSTLTQSTDALKGITDNLGTIFLLSTIVSVLIIVLYVSNVIRKRKVEKGNLQMQKDVHELLEIERAKIQKVQPPVENQNNIL